MYKKILLALILIFLNFSHIYGNSELPFTDINTNDELYNDLLTLYQNNIIKKTADNKFYPNSPIRRDEFVGIVVGVGCKDCINPSPDDLLKYVNSSFPDVNKSNPYYYCISTAKDKGMSQGYVLGDDSKHTCDNGETFTTSPFCPANKITRIEAATILLRSTNLWNDELNANIPKGNDIVDVDNKWYGFAKKSVEIGLIKINSDKKIFPNENITKREFVHMANKIFALNFCTLKDNSISDFSSEIKIYDKNSENSCTKNGQVSNFSNNLEKTYDFFAYTERTGDFEYVWEFTNTITGEIKMSTGKCLDDYIFDTSGQYTIKLTIKDKKTGELSTSYSNININNVSNSNSGVENIGISVNIGANPLVTETFSNIDFSTITKGGSGELSYSWSFGDATFSEDKNPTHKYINDGVYTVTLKVTDEYGNTGISQINVEINNGSDMDNDGIKDKNDLCPQINGPKDNNGCPNINEFQNIENQEGDNNSGSTNTNNDSGIINNGNDKGNITGDIKIFDNNNSNSCNGEGDNTAFSNKTETTYDFYGYTETVGNYEYIWEFKNTTTNTAVITATGKCLNNFDLINSGKWIVTLKIKDKGTGDIQNIQSQINISNNNSDNNLSVDIGVNKLEGIGPSLHQFNSNISGGTGDKTYKWDFGDGNTSNEKNPEHIFIKPGSYNVVLIVTDSNGNIGKSSIVIQINDKTQNSDKKGNNDSRISISTCMQKLSEGVGTIEGLLYCNTCPCSYNIDFLANIRNCDIIFPTIMNPNKNKIYSRGSLFEILDK